MSIINKKLKRVPYIDETTALAINAMSHVAKIKTARIRMTNKATVIFTHFFSFKANTMTEITSAAKKN